MKYKKLPFTFLAVATLFLCSETKAQLYINSATFFIQPGATVTVQGNITSNTSIQGSGGLVVLNGTANQTVDMGGDTIYNLQINNAANAKLLSNVIVGNSLAFTSGKITLGINNLYLSSSATTTGGSTGNFIETDSTGQAIKNLNANLTSYVVPVGVGSAYRPALLTTTGTYSGSANVGVRASRIADPSKPPMISDYLLTYWPITQTGITGTLNVTGQYNGTSDISGSQSNLKGYFYNGTDWSSTTGTSTTGSNQIATNVTGNGDVYGMDGFIVLKAKVFLQGAYNSTTQVMSDALRTSVTYWAGNPPTGNLIPSSDPYRTVPYNTSFTHVNNTITETAAATVFYDQLNANNNIVDWVYLELRNTATSGNTILQTRSALLQRDGDIVDVDGVSPVTFNNLATGSYIITVRHRNHLALSLNPVNTSKLLSEAQSTSTTLDFTTSTATNLLGTAGTNYLNDGTVNMLYAGNANYNTNTKYTGPTNDKDYMLSTVLGGVSTATITGYNQGDINLNRTVKFAGPGNDKDFLLSTVLAGNGQSTKTQLLPQ